MKKELLIVVLFMTGAVFAGEFVSETTGVLACTSSTKETIVSIPWVGYGKDAKIKVNEIIRTAGLEAGDKLLAPDGQGGYDSWTLTNGAWVADPKTKIGKSGADSQPGADATKELVRGDGFWLIKAKTPEKPFTYYLIGQQPATVGVTVPVSGTPAGKWFLVAPTSTAKVNILDLVNEAVGGDLITLADGTQYIKARSGWRLVGKDTGLATGEVVSEIPLAPGHGFWYASHANNELSL